MEKYIEIVALLISFVSLLVATATAFFIMRQYKIQGKEQSNRIMLDLLDRHNKIRNDFIDISNQINQLEIEINNCFTKQSFIEIYSKIEYNRIREIGYFYEYVGLIIKREIIDFSIVDDMFSFPLLFWKETEGIRNCVRSNCKIPDYWQNFEYLFNLYEKK